MRLDGKIALVTGGALRVGRVLSLALADAGADVVINHYRTPKEAMETQRLIEAKGRRCLPVEADVSSIVEGRAMVDTIEKEFGRLDILVHNAGNFNFCPFEQVTEAVWDSSLNLILKGPFFLSQAAGRLMMKHKSGRIMAITGNSIYENWPDFIPHAIAKTGMGKLMQELAVAYSPYIQCNAICPGTILRGDDGKDDEQRAKRGESSDDIIINGIRLFNGSPDDLAELVVYLSGCGGFLTGQVISIDGGKTII